MWVLFVLHCPWYTIIHCIQTSIIKHHSFLIKMLFLFNRGMQSTRGVASPFVNFPKGVAIKIGDKKSFKIIKTNSNVLLHKEFFQKMELEWVYCQIFFKLESYNNRFLSPLVMNKLGIFEVPKNIKTLQI